VDGHRSLLVDEHGVPNLEVALQVLYDVAKGMAYLHANNIIHGGLSYGPVGI
jgi:hypothetical protein